MNRTTNATVLDLTLSRFSELQRAELEEALRSDSLEYLHLYFDNYNGVSNLDFFLRALENLPETVVLHGRATSPDTVGQFLNVISRNSNITMLVLANLLFPMTSLASLLRVSDSVIALYIQGCEVAESPGSWEDDFVTAFHGNRVFHTFAIHDSDVTYMRPIVEQFGNHRTLRMLLFIGNSPDGRRRSRPSPATSNVIRSILENGTSPMDNIECRGFEFDRACFLPIARGAIEGKLSNILRFRKCSFDKASTELFEMMFRPNSNLRRMELECGSVSFTKQTNVILDTILHKDDSPLKELCISLLGMDNREDGNALGAVMEALKVNTSLWYFAIANGADLGDEVVEALQTGLPKLRGLKELSCLGLRLDHAQRLGMMEAFKRNHSICKTWGVQEAFPNEEDKKTLRLYAARNENIPTLIKNPARIPLAAWPRVFKIVEPCEFGANTVFRALMELEERVGQPKQSRERRRSDCEL